MNATRAGYTQQGAEGVVSLNYTGANLLFHQKQAVCFFCLPIVREFVDFLVGVMMNVEVHSGNSTVNCVKRGYSHVCFNCLRSKFTFAVMKPNVDPFPSGS